MSVTVNTSNVKVVTAETDAGTEVTVQVNGAIPIPVPSPGPQGEKGDKGDKGDTGEQGPQGNPTTVNGKIGATITLTKADIGLGNVPNTDATNPANITQASSYRFVSDTEKATWNGKQNALAYMPEDVALKQNSLATPDSSHYPTTQAVSSALSAKADLVNGKVPLSQINDALIGNVHYKGLYNFSAGLITSDDTALDGQPLPTATSGNVGWYFISADSGTLNGIDFITGDWIISNGSYGWHKVDNTDAVSSVNGYTGNVVLSKADIGLGNVPNTDATNPANTVQTTSYRYVSDAEKATWNGKQNALGYTPVDNTTTVNGKALSANITLTKADIGLGNVANADTTAPSNIVQSALYRFVSDTEKAAWNAKQAAITTGSASQYLKGDLSLGTMPTALSQFTNDLGLPVYINSGSKTLSSTINWVPSGNAPSGTTNHTYQWVQIGKLVTVRFNLLYATPGSALTQLSIYFPPDLPAVDAPAGYVAAAANLSYNGVLPYMLSAVTGSTAIVRGNMHYDPTPSNWRVDILVNGTSNAIAAGCTFSYFTT